MNVVKSISDTIGRIRDIWRLGQRAPAGRVMVSDPQLDSFRIYVSDQLNPSSLKTYLRAADAGDLATTLGLFEEMEGKDLHLQGVANTRRGALTGLEWEVVSAAESQCDAVDKTFADEAAAFVEESFANLDCFDSVLEHLATAIGPNLAVAELVWERAELTDIEPIPTHRLRTDASDLQKVRVVTAKNAQGVDAVAPKFVVHVPRAKAGFPFSMTLSHAQAFVYLIKLLSVADWASYTETFGQPVRWATWPPNATTADKQELIDMLKNMGSSAYAAFSEGVNLQLIESSQRGTSPFKDLVEWCARQQSIGWLGQNLTTDTTGGTGTFAAASVQNEVRRDLLEDDVRRESRTVRQQIIAPMVAFRFPQGRWFESNRGLPVFRRRFREEVDRKAEAEIIGLAQQAGVRVSRDWAHDRLAIPKPEPDQEVLEPSLDAFGAGLTEDVGAPV